MAKKCDAMEGLTMSGEHVIENTITGTEVRDTGINMSGLKVENFEITSYTGLGVRLTSWVKVVSLIFCNKRWMKK